MNATREIDALMNPCQSISTADRAATFALLKQLSLGIARLFAPYCEVVIHDFSDLEASIIHIEGDISGRQVGGGATDLLLTEARNGNFARDFHNYQTALPNGRKMKSCTMFLRDEGGAAYGALCINLDVGIFEAAHRILGEFLALDAGSEVSETLSDDIQSTIHSILREAVNDMGAELPIMSKEDKIELIARLDEKGAFQVKRAVPLIAEELGLSRSTIYNYLTEAREKSGVDAHNGA
ncbi:MAG: PAS domain-containing protein [Chloroflexota bacterium]|nr:PAS domain-containing protein [Chloroflexota bacterium]MDE2852801.1 PAS domain-containing protein [Chloroflexota bacterium]MDE2946216.1 PAS domain-containing protein [Chloroflexota bacterium]